MKRDSLRILFGLATSLVLSTHALAAPAATQDAAEASTQALPAATTILDKFEQVTNSKAITEKTKCSHATGKLTMAAMGVEGTMEVWEAKPGLSIAKIEMAAVGTVTMGYIDGVAYELNPMTGARMMEGMELLQRSLDSDYGPAKSRSRFETIETVAKEKFEGKDCYKLKLVAKPLEGMDAAATLKGRTVHEFYEVESGLLVGSVGTSETPMGEMPVTNVISDYKKFGEAMVATKTTQKMAMGEMVIEILSVEYPAEVDMAMFELPKEIAAQVQKEKAAGAK